jgi:hypothetical protein
VIRFDELDDMVMDLNTVSCTDDDGKTEIMSGWLEKKGVFLAWMVM